MGGPRPHRDFVQSAKAGKKEGERETTTTSMTEFTARDYEEFHDLQTVRLSFRAYFRDPEHESGCVTRENQEIFIARLSSSFRSAELDATLSTPSKSPTPRNLSVATLEEKKREKIHRVQFHHLRLFHWS